MDPRRLVGQNPVAFKYWDIKQTEISRVLQVPACANLQASAEQWELAIASPNVEHNVLVQDFCRDKIPRL